MAVASSRNMNPSPDVVVVSLTDVSPPWTMPVGTVLTRSSVPKLPVQFGSVAPRALETKKLLVCLVTGCVMLFPLIENVSPVSPASPSPAIRPYWMSSGAVTDGTVTTVFVAAASLFW